MKAKPLRASCVKAALTLCLGCLAAAAPAQEARDPRDVVEAYAAAVAGGQWTVARNLWWPDYLAEAAALGIRYRGQPCPWDLASPLLLQRLALRTGEATREVAPAVVDGDEAAVVVRVLVDGRGQDQTYGLIRAQGSWHLCGRIWLAGRHWPTRRTRTCLVHVQRPELLTDAACTALDAFVAETAARAGADPRRLASLASTPIPYYLADDETVAALTGYPTRGMADLAGGAVISSHFPHFHELAHLVVNWSLQDVPLYTSPLLQEGLACRLGGRWGRAPAVILYTGWFHLDQGLLTVEEVLTRDGFLATPAGPDGAYGVGALVCDLVRTEAGWPAVMDLYRSLSGDLDEVAGLGAGEVAAAVGRACGWPVPPTPAALADSVARRAARWRRCGIRPGGLSAGRVVRAALTAAEGGASARLAGDELELTVAARSWPAVLLLEDRPAQARERAGEGGSVLFREQLPGRDWDGVRWGVVCRPTTCSFYDYVTNRVLGIWVADFSGEAPLTATAAGELVFTVDLPPGVGDGLAAGGALIAP